MNLDLLFKDVLFEVLDLFLNKVDVLLLFDTDKDVLDIILI